MKDPILWLIMCGPLVLALCAWAFLLPKQARPQKLTLIALSAATANALFAAGIIVYYSARTMTRNLPPWQDPVVLNTALLMLTAPIAAILGFVALARQSPKWVVLVVELIAFPLFVIGCLASNSV